MGAFVYPSLMWNSNTYIIFGMYVCSLIYPACYAHVPYYIAICGLSGLYFSTYLIKGTTFEKVTESKTCVLIF